MTLHRAFRRYFPQLKMIKNSESGQKILVFQDFANLEHPTYGFHFGFSSERGYKLKIIWLQVHPKIQEIEISDFLEAETVPMYFKEFIIFNLDLFSDEKISYFALMERLKKEYA